MKENSKKLLLASDDREWCHNISSFMVPIGYIVHAVNDGNSVISTLAKMKYDIVFLATNLPGKNGMQTLEAIEKVDNGPIIAMVYKGDIKHNIREYLMNGACVCIWKTLGGEDFQVLCDRLLEKGLRRDKVWTNIYCPFYRSTCIECPMSEGVKDLGDLITVMDKCISDYFYECSIYRELNKQRDQYSGVERRRFVRIDTDIPMRYEVCGEAGVKYASVRDISEKALRFEAKQKVADHAIISAGLQIPGEDNILQIMGRGVRKEKTKRSDRYDIVMMYQLIDKQSRRIIKKYIKRTIKRTYPDVSILRRIRERIKNNK